MATTRIFILFFTLFGILFAKENERFTIFTFPYDDHPNYLSKIYAILKKERANTQNSLTCLQGDVLFPFWLSASDAGKHVIHVLNEMDIDYIAVGMREFDYGMKPFLERVEESKFLWLNVNIIDENNQPLKGVYQAAVAEIGAYKIGIIGVLPQKPEQILHPAGTYTLSSQEAVSETVKSLKQMGVDVIVVISHLSQQENNILVKEIEDIDLIIAKHNQVAPVLLKEHSYLLNPTNDSLMRIDLVIEEGKIFPVISCLQDVPDVKEKVLYDFFQYDTDMDAPVAKLQTHVKFRSNRVNDPMMVFFADVFKSLYSADACLILNPNILTKPKYHKGYAITKKDVLQELCWDGPIVVLEIAKEDLKKILQQMLNLKMMPVLSGIDITFGKNDQIDSIHTNKEIIKIATYEYFFTYFEIFANCDCLLKDTINCSNRLVDYLMDRKKITLPDRRFD